MDRAFSSGASGTPPSAPGSPSTGYATSGNPGTATPATKPGAYWYHMVTEELRALIVAAGLTPDHTNTSQIAQAVQAMIAAGAANDFKASVRAATTANIASLAGGAPNTLDGVTLVANNRILVKDQTTGSQNGIYVVTTLGTGANGTWSRSADVDQVDELTAGAIVMVEEGTTLADSLWELTTDGTITIGTTSLTWVRKDGSVVPDASTSTKGKVQLATNAEAQALTDALKSLTPATLAAALQGSNQSFAANGYQKLPGGLILQWGTGVIGSGTVTTFPVAFPTACYLVVANALNACYVAQMTAIAAANFTSTSVRPLTEVAVSANYYWLAIGR